MATGKPTRFLRHQEMSDLLVKYWNWGKSAFDPVNSPYFDGSAYSMGGNGVYEAHNCTNGLPTGLNCIPPGSGGGCVESGPFAK
jgi:tyrosinase